MLHGLVHCAAVVGPRTPLAFYPANDWAQVLQVNLTAAFLLTQALLPALHAAPGAHILFSSAAEGLRGAAYWGAYAVSKFGVEALAQVLREELAATSKISVHVIDPGPTRTALRAAAFRAEDPAHLPTADDKVTLYLALLDVATNGPRPERVVGHGGSTGAEH